MGVGLAIAGIGLAVGGTALSMHEENVAAQDAAHQANVNARIADLRASDALSRGARAAGILRTRTSKLVARQRVAYANSGVDESVGTPAQVEAATRAQGELDAQTAKNNAAREAWGYESGAIQLGLQGQIDRQRAQQQQIGTFLGGTGKVLGGIGGIVAHSGGG